MNESLRVNSKTAVFFDKVAFLCVLLILMLIPHSIGGIETCLVIGVIAWILARQYQDNSSSILKPLFLPISFYLLAVALSFFNATKLEDTNTIFLLMRGLLRIAKYFLLFFMAAETVRTKSRLQWVVRIMMIAAFLACLNGFHQMITGWDFRNKFPLLVLYGVERVQGSFNHPNNFAAYLSVALSIILYFRDNKFWNFLRIPAFFCLMYALILTSSRMPILILIGLFLIASVCSKNYRKDSLIALALIIACFLVYKSFDSEYFYRFQKMVYGDARWYYWRESFRIAKEHILFGHGINTFMSQYSNSVDSNIGDARFTYAHNFLLQYLVEVGGLGLGAFLFFIFTCFKNIRRNFLLLKEPFKHQLFGIAFSLAFFLLHSMVDNNLQSLQLSTLFWALLGCAIGTHSFADARLP